MKILVFGWYHQNNLGDDLFIDAFQALFPSFDFKFVNEISLNDLQDVDGVFIGGGSFLTENIRVQDDETYNLLKSKKIFYLGVGLETEINVFHYELMKAAKLIATRTPRYLEKALSINVNSIAVPDLVYYLKPTKSIEKIAKSVLIIPNISVVPTWNEPHWKHASWDYFKTEFTQLLDILVKDGFTVGFLPLCTNFRLDDSMAAAEIINRMMYRNHFILPKKNNLASVTETISRYNVVVTQRYHGIVLAEMVGTPCLSIYHHDKLKDSQGPSIPYYGVTKDKLYEQIDRLFQAKISPFLPIDRDMFSTLQRRVDDALRSDQR